MNNFTSLTLLVQEGHRLLILPLADQESRAADFLQSQSEAMQRQRDPEMAQNTRLQKESPRLEF